MTHTPPKGADLDLEAIRALAVPDPAMSALIASFPIKPLGKNPVDSILQRRAEAAAYFTTMKAIQETTRVSTLREAQRVVALPTGHVSRTIVVRPTSADGKAPILVLFHSGGWAIGYPEFELDFARAAAEATGAVVILPTYRFAPEHPFPAAIEDGWALVRHVAQEAAAEPGKRKLLPPQADASAGFIVGGTCTGASIASAIAHLARDTALAPPLTGQFLAEGWYMFPATRVPAPYAPRWISYRENRSDPMMPFSIVQGMREVLRLPENGGLLSSFAWPNWDDGVDEQGRVGKGHVGLPPAYFQAAGLATARDDTLVYEAVLREESGVPTRLDVYPGVPHCSLLFLPQLPISQKSLSDRVEGLRWLLGHRGA